MEERVVITISTDGVVSVEVDGVAGPVCKDITEAVQRRLNGRVIESRDKPQMYSELDHLTQKVHNS